MNTSIDIKGTIISNDDKWIYDWYDIESVCPRDVLGKLNGTDDIDIYINSGGGDVIAASEIYEALRQYKGNVLIHVVGLAASAASMIMCARECDISPTSLVMIHNVSTGVHGDKNAMSHEAEVLSAADEAVCAAYQIKTGKSKDELLGMMNEETWLPAKKAVELGFCDHMNGVTTLTNGYCRMVTDEQRQKLEARRRALTEYLAMEENNLDKGRI
jgi:ATP-dependent Clp protease protease subunit